MLQAQTQREMIKLFGSLILTQLTTIDFPHMHSTIKFSCNIQALQIYTPYLWITEGHLVRPYYNQNLQLAINIFGHYFPQIICFMFGIKKIFFPRIKIHFVLVLRRVLLKPYQSWQLYVYKIYKLEFLLIMGQRTKIGTFCQNLGINHMHCREQWCTVVLSAA